MTKAKYDFSGYATKVDLKCSDGRVIKKDAFKHNDGQTVPLVWQHLHNDPTNILGHALLENRMDGVYAYCTFNNTDAGKNAKELVEHGDIKSLSIYANQLTQKASDVVHGDIKEVSLVLAGANPGALIDNLTFQHSDNSWATVDDEAIIFSGDNISLNDVEHADNASDNEETIKDVFDTLNDKQKEVVYAMIAHAINSDQNGNNNSADNTAEHSANNTSKDNSKENSGANDNLKKAMDMMDQAKEMMKGGMTGNNKEMINQARDMMDQAKKMMDEAEKVKHSDSSDQDNEKLEHSNKGEEQIMKRNIFDKGTGSKENTLSHADEAAIFADVKKYGSLKTSAIEHGITNIDFLFPDATSIDGTPQFIKRDTGWVAKVMAGVHHTPFSRIKSILADITKDEARARGYIKGNLKADEVFSLLKRTTSPTTIYKKQKLDRDDVVDITDFDVVAWIKAEMRIMLDEEIARGILIGDGRLASSDDKIKEDCLRPIWKDDDLYSVKVSFDAASTMTDDEKAKAFIKATIKARKNYKGSGDPTMHITEDMLTNCLLLEDTTGRRIYASVADLALALRVKEIVSVPVMENQTRTSGTDTMTLHGIMVNLNDYNVGADKGGAVNMFDDFDIDYNAQKYLIETRASGALTVPYSALVIESKAV